MLPDSYKTSESFQIIEAADEEIPLTPEQLAKLTCFMMYHGEIPKRRVNRRNSRGYPAKLRLKFSRAGILRCRKSIYEPIDIYKPQVTKNANKFLGSKKRLSAHGRAGLALSLYLEGVTYPADLLPKGIETRTSTNTRFVKRLSSRISRQRAKIGLKQVVAQLMAGVKVEDYYCLEYPDHFNHPKNMQQLLGD